MHIEYNTEKIQKCLRDFRIAFSFPVCFIARDFQSQVSYSQARILKDSIHSETGPDTTTLCHYIRENEECNERCVQSDINACILCEQMGGKLNYRCWLGFNEYCVVVRENDITYGYLLAGQNVTAGLEKETLSMIVRKSREMGFNEEIVSHCFKGHRVLDQQQQESSQSLLNACASYLIAEGAVYNKRDSDESRLDNYIDEHLSDDLSISSLCTYLGYNKAMIRKLSQALFGTSIQQAIRRKRIEKSCELLKNTSEMIHDIACEVGIPDYNYFTKLFRNDIGMTPRDYRKAFSLIEVPTKDD